MADLQSLELVELQVDILLLVGDEPALDHDSAVLAAGSHGRTDQIVDDVVQKLLVCLDDRDQRAAVVRKADVLGREGHALRVAVWCDDADDVLYLAPQRELNDFFRDRHSLLNLDECALHEQVLLELLL